MPGLCSEVSPSPSPSPSPLVRFFLVSRFSFDLYQLTAFLQNTSLFSSSSPLDPHFRGRSCARTSVLISIVSSTIKSQILDHHPWNASLALGLSWIPISPSSPSSAISSSQSTFLPFLHTLLLLLLLHRKCLRTRLLRLPAVIIKTTFKFLPLLLVRCPRKSQIQVLPNHHTTHLPGAHRFPRLTTRPS